MGWDPVPGDGLFYTEHPVQGSLALAIGLIGGIALTVGVFGKCSGGDIGDCEAIGNATTIVGSALYGTSYLWDGIGSTIAAKKYKKGN
ncbi:MAG: hypothetical protein HY877_04380 [Deltaproteobacteria bacterium]|nr:hypothetical protein [Deltaproteobacteria bacterium]